LYVQIILTFKQYIQSETDNLTFRSLMLIIIEVVGYE